MFAGLPVLGVHRGPPHTCQVLYHPVHTPPLVSLALFFVSSGQLTSGTSTSHSMTGMVHSLTLRESYDSLFSKSYHLKKCNVSIGMEIQNPRKQSIFLQWWSPKKSALALSFQKGTNENSVSNPGAQINPEGRALWVPPLISRLWSPSALLATPPIHLIYFSFVFLGATSGTI